jgi:aspartate/methionine/tyrosine aminotransferase
VSEASTLTEQEISAASRAEFDVGPGYPQIPLPHWCVEHLRDERLFGESIEVAPSWTPKNQEALRAALESAVRQLLRIPTASIAVFETFSGSVALDRAMTAVIQFARARNRSTVHVVTTTPCIDIMKLFLAERAEVSPVFVPSDRGGEFPYGLNEVSIISALRAVRDKHPRTLPVVLLTSPENPTGETWSSDSLKRIAEACEACDGVIIVDHCFLLAGVQESRPPAVWDVVHRGDWIGIWDTGKTIGINEEKLGFVIAGGVHMPRYVSDSINTVQFGVSRRQKLMIGRILGDPRFKGHLEELRSVCRTNLSTLVDALSGNAQISIRKPTAGSLVLVDCSGVRRSDEEIRTSLLSQGVGVIAGRVFFHTESPPTSFIRVALAREPEFFRRAVSKLAGLIDGLPARHDSHAHHG